MDLHLGGWLVHGNEFPEELSVPECLPACSANSDEVLVELAYLDDYASPVPFVWVRASLVLDLHSVAYL